MWKGFNTPISLPTKIKTTVSHLPSIDDKPRTVHTVSKDGINVARTNGQNYNIHTFDQQIYAAAQHVILNLREEFKHTIVRLGGFHTSCTFIACIGKL